MWESHGERDSLRFKLIDERKRGPSSRHAQRIDEATGICTGPADACPSIGPAAVRLEEPHEPACRFTRHASDPPRPAWVAPRNRETMTEGLGEREQLLQATGLRAVRLDTRRRTAGSRRGPLCCEGRALDSVGEKANRATRRVWYSWSSPPRRSRRFSRWSETGSPLG